VYLQRRLGSVESVMLQQEEFAFLKATATVKLFPIIRQELMRTPWARRLKQEERTTRKVH
jgi:hypothetical protein